MMRKEMKNSWRNSTRPTFPKGGQITIFIILAILIVGGVIIYFTLIKRGVSEIPQNFKPVYDYYLSCIEQHARDGLNLLGEQGGYIYTEDLGFVPGSQYMPFSSQLNFFGQAVPYWLYVSGNNIMGEQVPSRTDMEKELEEYVEERLDDCDFSDFEAQGFNVFVNSAADGGRAGVKINDYDVDLDIKNNLIMSFGEQSISVNEHKVKVESKIGKFHSLALDVYNYEKQNMFLEKYAVDVMRLYAPVDGVEITCAPKIFNEQEIKTQLVEALSANIGALKLKGNYYDLASKDNQYFVTDIGQNVDEQVNFIYSPDWTTRIEIYGEMVVEPVGLQEGLGILGFCYVPYHFVYDIDFPVLIQFYDFSGEIFQFPIAVVIDKNQERSAFYGTAGQDVESDVCKYRNENVRISTYDSELNPIEARIRFRCLNTECSVGSTNLILNKAVLDAELPACVNGFLIADAEGYAKSKYLISTNEEKTADILLDKLYDVEVVFNPASSGKEIKKALVRFEGQKHSATLLYPEMNKVGLIEDYYNVSVYIYEDSILTFPETNERKCVNVPKEGIGGVFGLEEEKCFDVTIPQQEIAFAVVGGGNSADYMTEDMLRDSGKLSIEVLVFGTPRSLEEVQQNYIKVEDSLVYLEFLK